MGRVSYLQNQVINLIHQMEFGRCEGTRCDPIKEEGNELFWAQPALTRHTCRACSVWKNLEKEKTTTVRDGNEGKLQCLKRQLLTGLDQ